MTQWRIDWSTCRWPALEPQPRLSPTNSWSKRETLDHKQKYKQQVSLLAPTGSWQDCQNARYVLIYILQSFCTLFCTQSAGINTITLYYVGLFQPCHDKADFRNYQCSQYDTRPVFSSSQFKWTAYYGE